MVVIIRDIREVGGEEEEREIGKTWTRILETE